MLLRELVRRLTGQAGVRPRCVSDTLYDGRRFRTLNVLDGGNREALAVEVGTSLPGPRVVAVLDQLVAVHGVPNAVRCDGRAPHSGAKESVRSG